MKGFFFQRKTSTVLEVQEYQQEHGVLEAMKLTYFGGPLPLRTREF